VKNFSDSILTSNCYLANVFLWQSNKNNTLWMADVNGKSPNIFNLLSFINTCGKNNN